MAVFIGCPVVSTSVLLERRDVPADARPASTDLHDRLPDHLWRCPSRNPSRARRAARHLHE
jgi:hypothetical protein